MRKEGERLVIEPTPAKWLLTLLAALDPLGKEFPEIDELETDPVDL